MNRQWKGYTLDEIRAQRVLNKQRIRDDRQRLLNPAPAVAPGLMQRTGSSPLNYIYYAVMTFTITRRLVSYLRNRRKNK